MASFSSNLLQQQVVVVSVLARGFFLAYNLFLKKIFFVDHNLKFMCAVPPVCDPQPHKKRGE